MMHELTLTNRYLARITIQLTSAMKIGTGASGLIMDEAIVRDINSLPYIPGTSLAGVLRHFLEDAGMKEDDLNDLFGYQKDTSQEGKGSRILLSDALLLSWNGEKVHEGLERSIEHQQPYYQYSKRLAERDHVKINQKGTAVDRAKYEEELVRKGTRFVFMIEMEADDSKEEKHRWEELLDAFHSPIFRIGGGTRKGLGAFEVVSDGCQTRSLDLRNVGDLNAYLKISSSLNNIEGWSTYTGKTGLDKDWKKVTIQLKAKDFFLFGAGVGLIPKDMVGTPKTDNGPKTEEYFIWNDAGQAKLVAKNSHLLIPATSIKGAISHRIAFYFNQAETIGNFIENSSTLDLSEEPKIWDVSQAIAKTDLDHYLPDLDNIDDLENLERLKLEIESLDYKDEVEWKKIAQGITEAADLSEGNEANAGEENEAVKALFGFAKQVNETDTPEEEQGARGNIIFTDAYLALGNDQTKVFNHVAIDRFTGGGRDGALFQEEVTSTEEVIKFDMYVNQSAFNHENPIVGEAIRNAFTKAIADLETGQLPLGGSTNRGHGIFFKPKSTPQKEAV